MRTLTMAVLAALLSGEGLAAEAVVELEPEAEIEMALSAAPEHLRAEAGVYRLGKQGYEQVRPSANGFNCLVVREASLGTAPVCYDDEGSETILKADFMRGELLRQGKSRAEIDALIAEEYRAGRLIAPRKPGISYMLSTHFSQASEKNGGRECIFPPHLMFYAPYARNADIGADRRHFGSTTQPWILNEGKPDAYILVVGSGVDAASCH